jgi:hypothetical protein
MVCLHKVTALFLRDDGDVLVAVMTSSVVVGITSTETTAKTDDILCLRVNIYPSRLISKSTRDERGYLNNARDAPF